MKFKSITYNHFALKINNYYNFSVFVFVIVMESGIWIAFCKFIGLHYTLGITFVLKFILISLEVEELQ